MHSTCLQKRVELQAPVRPLHGSAVDLFLFNLPRSLFSHVHAFRAQLFCRSYFPFRLMFAGISPEQQFVQVMNHELVEIMGSKQAALARRTDGNPTVILLAGLQGTGKTTAAAKLAKCVPIHVSCGSRHFLVMKQPFI